MNKPSKYEFIMISAMYENGGNTTQRLLDGHPELMVYPFESQPGSKFVNDYLSSMYPLKYRWPVFPVDTKLEDLYEIIIDEEGKVRSKTPFVSKFRDAEFTMTDKERKSAFVKYLKGKDITRANIMAAFFVATFEAWKNFNRTGKEHIYVGYSPIIGVDGDKIINDYKGNGYVLHVVRNPFSAYGDTKKRPVPLSIAHYMTGWIMCQQMSLLYAKKYPKNYFIVRYEDIIKNPKKVLGDVLANVGAKPADTLTYPSWNGAELQEVYPWGTIRIPTEEVNIKTAQELSKEEIAEIYDRTRLYIDELKYNDVYKKIR